MILWNLDKSFGAPLQAVIEPRDTALLVLVPPMTEPQPSLLSLAEFFRERGTRYGYGVVSFLPPLKHGYDDTAHSHAANCAVRAALQHYAQAAHVIVACAPMPALVRARISNGAAYQHGCAGVAVQELPLSSFQRLPDRVAFANTIPAHFSQMRAASLAQHHRPQ